jgi:hypothetical protein
MDQQLQDLIDQMRDLVKVLKVTSGTPTTSQGKTGADSSGQNVTKLINALGQLAVKLDGTRRTRAEEMQAMKRFAANVNRATTAQDAQADAIAKNIQKTKDEAAARAEASRIAMLSAKDLAAEQLAAQQRAEQDQKKARNNSLSDAINAQRRSTSTSRQVFDEMSMAGSSADLLKNKFLDLGGDSLKAQAGLQLFVAGIEGVTKSLTTYSTALYKGERGAAVSAKALNDLATPILGVIDTLGTIISIGSFFLPGGTFVKVFMKGLAVAGGGLLSLGANAAKLALKFNTIAAEQADKLFKSFNELSTVGAAGAEGMDGVFTMLQTMGMSAAEIEEFNKLIVSSGGKLALMGTTAAEGAKEFSAVAGGLYKSDLGRQLEMLGINAGEQREAALAYMNIQARTGQMQLKSTRQLIEESAKFAKELDLSAQLTGQTRKEQQAAREAAMAETRFRAALIDAEQRGDQDEMARLQQAQRMAAIAKGMGDERGFTGILQAAAGGGALATPEAVAAEMTYGVNQILSQPNLTDAQMLQQMGASVKLQEGQLAGINKFIGGIDVLQTNLVAGNDLQRRAVLLSEGAAKAGFTGPDAITKFLETEQGKRIAAGGDTKLMVEAGRAQQGAAMTMDSVVKTFNGAANIHETAAKSFNDAVNLFAKTVGAQPVAGGIPTTNAPLLPPEAPAIQQATVVAKETRELANTVAEQAAAAGDAVKEAEKALETAKKSNATKEEQAKVEQRILDAKKEQERLEQEEIRAAREARQRELEAKNARREQRRTENAAKATGQAAPAGSPNAGMPPAPGATGQTAPSRSGAGAQGAATAPVGAKVQEKPIATVLAAGPGFTTVATTDNDKQQRKGARNWRNNNPGNLEFGDFAKSMGAVGTDGRFAVFPDMQAGMRAKEELLFGARSKYVNLSIADAISRYAPPIENNTDAYIKAVTAATTATRDTTLNSLNATQRSAFLEAINRQEGFRPGDVLQAAEGGILKSQPGGTLVNAAEVGVNEAFVPLPKGKKIPVDFGRNTEKIFRDISDILRGTSNSTIPQQQAYSNITPLISSIGDANKATISQLYSDIASLISGISDTNKATTTQAYSDITSMIGGIGDANKTSTTQAYSDITSLINGISDNLVVAGPTTTSTTSLGNGKDNIKNLKDMSPESLLSPNFDVKILATAIASEIKSALRETATNNQPQDINSGVIVDAINEMVREQRTTNTISQRILQVSQA